METISIHHANQNPSAVLAKYAAEVASLYRNGVKAGTAASMRRQRKRSLAKVCEAARKAGADRVIVGTGYDVDVDRLSFLDRGLRREVARIERAPKLNATFESSVPGLYFIGPASAMSFGPLYRFVAGTAYTSKIVSRRLAFRTSKK